MCMIHKRSDLEAVQKLSYLKSALKDEPKLLVKELASNANYDVALKLLQERFANNKFRAAQNYELPGSKK